MNDGGWRPADPLDGLMSGAPALAFLKYAVAFVLAGSAAFVIAIFVFAPDQTMRAFGPLSMSLVAATAWILLARGRTEAAVHVLAFGLWAAVTGIALFTGGVRGMAIIVYPQLILLVGWLIGTRGAVVMALLAVAATFGFALAESLDLLPLPPPTPPAMRWIVQSFVFAFSVILIVSFVRSYQDRLRQADKLGGELALRSAEVQAREADLNRAQAVAHVGSCAYDLATDVMHLSAESCRIFGLPEGITGNYKAHLARVHPEDRAAVDGAWRIALKGVAPFAIEYRILVGKTIRWVRHQAELEFGADGRPLRSVGSMQDITERERKEEEYRTIIQASTDGFWITDSAGRILDVNESICRVLGYSREEMLRLRIIDIDADESPGDVAARTRQMMQAGSARFQARHRCKDGTVIDVEVSVQYVAALGERLFAFVRDITGRKRAQEALQQSEQRLRAIVETEPECVKVVGRDGGLLEMNAAGLAMLEAESVGEVQRHTLLGFLLPEYRAGFGAMHARVMGGESGKLEFEIVGLKGTRRWLETHAAPMRDAAGEVAMLLGITRDITERKRMEAERALIETQLRESQKMEALGTLAGGVAHDFNNIVATIMGNVDLACQDVGPGHAAQESLEEIRKASRRAKDLVQQILAFGRRQLIERSVISLAPVVEESVRLLRATLPAGVGMRVNCAPQTPRVLADATQVQQVLLNLCANAWQAMQGQPRPGTIEVSLEAHLAITAPYKGPERRTRGARVALRPGRYACITVHDTGPGMDEATRSRIFEPFFTTKPVGKGTGLGLAVVHGIVQDHGASIAVYSAQGDGATFRIYFPEAQSEAEPVPGEREDARPPGEECGEPLVLHGEGKSILYVDDDEAIVFLVTRLLERQGYRVSGYTDPREALAAVRAQPEAFDLAVTDFNMPGLSGLEMARALREIRADLPLALASGYITEELRAAAPAAGVSELIYKPNTVEEFCAVVARLANTLPV